jgi:hypothetical protein
MVGALVTIPIILFGVACEWVQRSSLAKWVGGGILALMIIATFLAYPITGVFMAVVAFIGVCNERR